MIGPKAASGQPIIVRIIIRERLFNSRSIPNKAMFQQRIRTPFKTDQEVINRL